MRVNRPSNLLYLCACGISCKHTRYMIHVLVTTMTLYPCLTTPSEPLILLFPFRVHLWRSQGQVAPPTLCSNYEDARCNNIRNSPVVRQRSMEEKHDEVDVALTYRHILELEPDT